MVLQFAGLDLNNQPILYQRYVPPHLRSGSIPEGGAGAGYSKFDDPQLQQAPQPGYPQQFEQPPPQAQFPQLAGPPPPPAAYGPPRGGGAPRGGRGEGHMNGRVYNNTNGRGGHFQNGYANGGDQRWNGYEGGRGGRGGGRGGYQNGGWNNGGYQNGNVERNNRWQEDPAAAGNTYAGNRGGRAGYGYTSGYNNSGQMTAYNANAEDWKTPLPKDERVESELFSTGNTGINFDKYEDIPVEATGNDVPENISTFDDLTFSEIIQTNIALARYTRPTPVQKYAIPIVMAGRDLMGKLHNLCLTYANVLCLCLNKMAN